MKEIKSIEDLFTVKGTLNSALIRRDWYKQSIFHLEILNQTKHLGEDVSYLERVHHFKYGLHDKPTCTICGNDGNFNPYATQYGEYTGTCTDRSCISSYTADKRLVTTIAKYGKAVSPNHRSQNPEAVKDFIKKSKQTLTDKYGVLNASQVPGSREKAKHTLSVNFGVAHPSQIPKHQQKRDIDSLEFYQSLSNRVGVDSINDPVNVCKLIGFKCSECDVSDLIPTETFKWRARKCGTPCFSCSGLSVGSKLQFDVLEFIKSIYDEDVKTNDRTVLEGKELDVYLPDRKIAIEVNGIYWHSATKEEDAVAKTYHLSKTEKCAEQGIRLIHIFEDDWYNKTNQIKSRLQSLLSPVKIYARKCELDLSVSSKEASVFLKNNHVQGNVPSSIRLGLRFEGELIALMTFHKPRFTKDNVIELLRYCSKGNSSVIGGASKLLKAAKQIIALPIISYADRTWGDGSLYRKIGFTHVSNSAPSYRWIKGKISKSRYQTQKHKLAQLVENFDDGKSEAENMFDDGWRRLWDCGTTKWILN